MCASCWRGFGRWVNGGREVVARPAAAETWLSPKQVAERLGLSYKTVLDKISSGKLPASVISANGKGVGLKRIRAVDVDRLLEPTQRTKPDSPARTSTPA